MKKKKGITRNSTHFWTKEEIKKLLAMWNDKSTTDLAVELNLSNPQISYMACQIRKAGYPLPRKRKSGTTREFILETLRELKLVK